MGDEQKQVLHETVFDRMSSPQTIYALCSCFLCTECSNGELCAFLQCVDFILELYDIIIGAVEASFKTYPSLPCFDGGILLVEQEEKSRCLQLPPLPQNGKGKCSFCRLFIIEFRSSSTCRCRSGPRRMPRLTIIRVCSHFSPFRVPTNSSDFNTAPHRPNPLTSSSCSPPHGILHPLISSLSPFFSLPRRPSSNLISSH